MHINVRLVNILQFFCQFSKLEICHKLGKEYIIPDVLYCITNTNTNLLSFDPEFSEIDVLFTYTTTSVDIHPNSIKRIINGYKTNE